MRVGVRGEGVWRRASRGASFKLHCGGRRGMCATPADLNAVLKHFIDIHALAFDALYSTPACIQIIPQMQFIMVNK